LGGSGIALYTTKEEIWFDELNELEATTIWDAIFKGHTTEVPKGLKLSNFMKEGEI
jgi:hypothetical protein